MDRTTQQPLTVAQAKQVLRDRAKAVSVRSYFAQHGGWLYTVAFVGGIVLGNRRVSRFISARLRRFYCRRLNVTEDATQSD